MKKDYEKHTHTHTPHKNMHTHHTYTHTGHHTHHKYTHTTHTHTNNDKNHRVFHCNTTWKPEVSSQWWCCKGQWRWHLWRLRPQALWCLPQWPACTPLALHCPCPPPGTDCIILCWSILVRLCFFITKWISMGQFDKTVRSHTLSSSKTTLYLLNSCTKANPPQ